MKKRILIGAAMLLTNLLMAQDNKMWLSGTASFRNYSGENDYKESEWNFSPGFGYCINPKIAVGISLGLNGETINEDLGLNEVETKTFEFTVAPFFRYYKPIVENKFALYGELNVAFGSGKQEFDNGTDTSEDTYGIFQGKVAPGLQYWISDSWSINAEWGALRYTAYNDKGDEDGEDDAKANEFEVGLDMSSISFGVNFHF